MPDDMPQGVQDWMGLEADFAHALALLEYIADRTDSRSESPRRRAWRGEVRMLVERHADVIERHRAPEDWRRGGAQ